MSNGSKIGSSFERDVSKFLSKWIQGTEKPYLFWRMPASGGLATISEENVDLSGDIRSLSPKSEWFTEKYSVECKNGYKKTSFWQHFKKIKGFNLEHFWRQCVDDASKGDKEPMLIYRKKGQKELVGFDHYWTGLNLPSIRMLFSKEKKLPPLVFYNMKDFFERITPEDIMNG
jgi:hypothetical protein